MRIITGKFKGSIIKFPQSKLVRPTTDKNKEAIFNYLHNIFEFEGALVCDIYAGSGSLGLEALSRGAERVDFVENNFKVSRILKENIDKLNVASQCRIILSDAIKFAGQAEHNQYDLILADPPFFKDDIHKVVELLKEGKFLSSAGLLLIERSIQTEDQDIAAFGIKPVKRLGDSLIYVFE